MLRSLVGSEMCIRDRLEQDLFGPGLELLGAHHERRQVEAESELDLPCPCLLYTSDAADELLCVDLGGRRIIKKKNRRTETDV